MLAFIKVYHLLVHGRWFSPGTSAFSTTKSGCHNIAEILLKVTLSTKKIKIIQTIAFFCYQSKIKTLYL
jgi:hypothetical protein